MGLRPTPRGLKMGPNGSTPMRTLLSLITCMSTNVEVQILMLMGRRSCARALNGHPHNSVQTIRNQSVGPLLDPSGYVSIRGSSMWRIIFEATESRRIVGWSNDYTVCKTTLAAPVIAKDRV